ncbi:hypothetical protein [Campylobacter sp. MIT 97-5078]|uniref:hypothetical protein n=1 Tax=Campylobacter sp. MIT 97-5078 TaxID=1548153 RepID=UPI0005148347|nr:hypothetical protein [Campylobacter sp. MIT 97-5078]KGI55833.1 hypothetical protein LR59_10175 [Campylobacter sp. MIT 97-5078]KGI56829.1 hypothetical protein LR59_04940 [Campylobacter sp. MIT 97-5078]TQR25607.1 hypothetical protein DMB91_07330 [Campylobacter sp. MIT 97-5078]
MFVKNIRKNSINLVAVVLLGALFIGCGNSKVEFKPEDEMGKVALKVAQEQVPDTKFYKYVVYDDDGQGGYTKDFTNRRKGSYFFLFLDKDSKIQRINIQCKSDSECRVSKVEELESITRKEDYAKTLEINGF